jgi:hypothetical protein
MSARTSAQQDHKPGPLQAETRPPPSRTQSPHSPRLELVHVQIVPNYGHQGGGRECGSERRKEREPGNVVRAHVGHGDGEKFDVRGLVLGFDWEGEAQDGLCIESSKRLGVLERALLAGDAPHGRPGVADRIVSDGRSRHSDSAAAPRPSEHFNAVDLKGRKYRVCINQLESAE